MKKHLAILFGLLLAVLQTLAQEPLYIVNGESRVDIHNIPPEQIEQIKTLPADEQTIAIYGQEASNGVMLITLRFDQPAEFPIGSFSDYIASQVDWKATEPAARIILRYKITPYGEVLIDKELESTDGRLRRRVLKAIEKSPRWQPAIKNDLPIESLGVLHIQLPEGKPMPQQMEVVWK